MRKDRLYLFKIELHLVSTLSFYFWFFAFIAYIIIKTFDKVQNTLSKVLLPKNRADARCPLGNGC